jgi:hypothetical protein
LAWTILPAFTGNHLFKELVLEFVFGRQKGDFRMLIAGFAGECFKEEKSDGKTPLRHKCAC